MWKIEHEQKPLKKAACFLTTFTFFAGIVLPAIAFNSDYPLYYEAVQSKPSSSNSIQEIIWPTLIQGYEIGSYAPLEISEPLPSSKITMHLCVDFMEKNCLVENIPTIINVYLKFKDSEIDKKEVLGQYFAVNKVHHKRLDILSVVIKPDSNSRLAPQKTQTNDMKATLLVKSVDEEPVILNAREVLADCDSLDPQLNMKQ